jgi:toxin-antitoxin system PIN domain toxin
VKVPDVNILLYALNTTSPRHARAREWLEEALSSGEAVGFTWLVLLGFLRLSTSPTIFPNPLSLVEAGDGVQEWLMRPGAVILHPTERHFAILRGLIERAGTAGKLVPDAHLAALAIEYDGEVISSDYDFGRFPGAAWMNPLT